MTKTLTQKVVFKNTTAKQLYELYMDSKKHSKAIGAPVKIANKVGGSFSAHGNYITGKNLQLVPGKMITQSWRGSDWSKTDLDSTFILQFEDKGKDTVVHMVHANVPADQASGVKSGWNEFYWKPWKKYLGTK